MTKKNRSENMRATLKKDKVLILNFENFKFFISKQSFVVYCYKTQSLTLQEYKKKYEK